MKRNQNIIFVPRNKKEIVNFKLTKDILKAINKKVVSTLTTKQVYEKLAIEYKNKGNKKLSERYAKKALELSNSKPSKQVNLQNDTNNKEKTKNGLKGQKKASTSVKQSDLEKIKSLNMFNAAKLFFNSKGTNNFMFSVQRKTSDGKGSYIFNTEYRYLEKQKDIDNEILTQYGRYLNDTSFERLYWVNKNDGILRWLNSDELEKRLEKNVK